MKTYPCLFPENWHVILSAAKDGTTGQLLTAIQLHSLAGPAQDEALNFAGRRLGQFRQELDPARVLERGQSLLDEVLEFVRQFVRWLVALLQDDICLWLDQFISVEITHDRCLQYGGVRDQRGLDLDRRDPLPAHLQHII